MRVEINRFLIEEIRPRINPLELKLVTGATLEFAKELDAKSGRFVESADYYYSVYETSKNQTEKLDAVLGLSQQLINLGRFKEARSFLYDSQSQVWNIQDINTAEYYNASIYQKFGWIADLEGNYNSSKQLFDMSRTSITHIDESLWTQREKEVYSTAIHFLGRANFGLAKKSMGQEKKQYLNNAISNFEEHLQTEGLADDEKGYGHAWLTRCYMSKNALGKAASEIYEVEKYFNLYLQTHSKRIDVISKLDLLRGEFEFRKGNFTLSRKNFEGILMDNQAKTKSMALYGIASTYWAQRNYGAAFIYGLKGFTTYPLSIIKPSL
ncbi:hypothetical protein BH10PAT1_BH10PAT1_6070 [soil metagenome]